MTEPNETWAPSGIAIRNNQMYVASLRGTAIIVIDLKSGEVIKTIKGFGRIRDVYIEKKLVVIHFKQYRRQWQSGTRRR